MLVLTQPLRLCCTDAIRESPGSGRVSLAWTCRRRTPEPSPPTTVSECRPARASSFACAAAPVCRLRCRRPNRWHDGDGDGDDGGAAAAAVDELPARWASHQSAAVAAASATWTRTDCWTFAWAAPVWPANSWWADGAGRTVAADTSGVRSVTSRACCS